jgi:hypothetical protein
MEIEYELVVKVALPSVSICQLLGLIKHELELQTYKRFCSGLCLNQELGRRYTLVGGEERWMML